MLQDDRRTIDEVYTCATGSSNLRVQGEQHRSDADVLVAAAWSASRVGAALMRLHSEWDGSAKTPLATAADFLARLPPKEFAAYRAVHQSAAAVQTLVFNLSQQRALIGRLQMLPVVRTQAILQLQRGDVADAEVVAPAVIHWWLNSICHACNGSKWEVVAGSNRQSNRACAVCHGTGLARVPHGESGKRLANWMDDCVNVARAQIANRLRNMKGRG